jgi:hypothetical protein
MKAIRKVFGKYDSQFWQDYILVATKIRRCIYLFDSMREMIIILGCLLDYPVRGPLSDVLIAFDAMKEVVVFELVIYCTLHSYLLLANEFE